MKLNVAAALFQSERHGRARLIVSLVLASLLFFSSGAVMAADEVDSVESEESAPEPHALATAIAKMARGGFRQLPIVDDRKCKCKVMKVSGVLHYLVEQFPELVYNLPPEPHQRTQQREGA